MSMPSLRATQHSVKLPDDVKEQALRWVQTQAATSHRRPVDAPFRRLIDFWFAAIAWAVHNRLLPAATTSGSKFVSIGPKSQDVNLEEWKCDLLTVLAVREFGHDDPRTQSAAHIVDLANRYAEAGAPALVAKLDSVQELAIPMLYKVTDLFTDEVKEVLAANETAM